MVKTRFSTNRIEKRGGQKLYEKQEMDNFFHKLKWKHRKSIAWEIEKINRKAAFVINYTEIEIVLTKYKLYDIDKDGEILRKLIHQNAHQKMKRSGMK